MTTNDIVDVISIIEGLSGGSIFLKSHSKILLACEGVTSSFLAV